MYQYPYGNAQQLNLDWILSKLQELESGSGGGADLEEVANALVSASFDATIPYRKYDYAFYDGKLYRALNDTIGAFNPADWMEVTLGADIPVLTRLVNADSALITTLQNQLQNLGSDEVANESTVTGTTVTAALDNLNGAINDNQLINLKWIRQLANGEDLDNLYVNGWYTTGNSNTYINSPIPNDSYGQRIVVVMAYNNEIATSYRHMFYANRTYGIYGHRVYASGRWTAWNTYGTNLLSESFTPSAIQTQGNYKAGTTIRVGSYNVAQYDNDTSTKIPDVKILNFRKFIADSKLDFLLTQEEPHYIDTAETKNTLEWLYQPVFDNYYSSSVWGNIIHCHGLNSAIASGKLAYSDIKSTSRCLGYAVFQITNDIKLLFITAHCVWKNYNDDPISAENIAGRLQNYKDIFEWANGTKTLPKYSDASAVTVPTHTHTIVCMDANSISDTDKNNLMTQATANNFTLGNGGRFGWFKTCIDRDGMYALDQIAVSNNIIINNIEPQMALYKQLYSDHVPVIAEVSLMPS